VQGVAEAPPEPAQPPVAALVAPRAAQAETGADAAPERATGGGAQLAAARAAPPAMVEALIRRGDAMLAIGDVTAARLLYERAAAGGSGRAALAAGRTYDPAVLGALNARGLRPDPDAAAAWYQRALALGEAEAAPLLHAVRHHGAR
jgi:TPR repeat protein